MPVALDPVLEERHELGQGVIHHTGPPVEVHVGGTGHRVQLFVARACRSLEGTLGHIGCVGLLANHHEQRLEETMKVVREHPGLGGYGIASHMTWRIRSNSWEDFPLTQKWFAVGECNAHLDYLVNRGELERVQKGQFYHYYAV